jgi:ArsR family transcriptional regulator, arsenate/arsenite/antimonite-responsive transcriptional repressor
VGTPLIESQEFQDFLKALASETRQKILFQFMNGRELTVNEVAQATGLGQSTASEHLSVLKRGGLLQARRQGKEVYYRPDRTRTLGMLRQLSDILSCCCPPE